MPLVVGAGYKLDDEINDSLADGANISYSAGKYPVSLGDGAILFPKITRCKNIIGFLLFSILR